jgi:hypothetical protein
MDLRRVAVVGTSCAGKATFAAALATKLQIPHIELDALHWRAGWIPVPPEVGAPCALPAPRPERVAGSSLARQTRAQLIMMRAGGYRQWRDQRS